LVVLVLQQHEVLHVELEALLCERLLLQVGAQLPLLLLVLLLLVVLDQGLLLLLLLQQKGLLLLLPRCSASRPSCLRVVPLPALLPTTTSTSSKACLHQLLMAHWPHPRLHAVWEPYRCKTASHPEAPFIPGAQAGTYSKSRLLHNTPMSTACLGSSSSARSSSARTHTHIR
jgi:hypothetical protein